MDSDKEKALNEAHEQVIAISFNQLPIDNIETYVIPEIMAFGTAIDEHIYNLEDYKSLIKRQKEQAESEGLNFHYKSETVVKRISPDQDSAILVDLVKACLKSNDEVVHQFNLRITMVLEYISGQWKLVHLHGSLPVDSENDPWHIEEYRREKERLERKVAEQTADLQIKNRELEIEAASERVRSQAMGMQKPEDIMSVLHVMKEEVEKFELENIGTWIWVFNNDQTLTQWDISEIDLNGTLANVNITMDLRESESSRRHAPKWKSADYYTMPWEGDDLQGLINEVKALDENSGRLFQEAVDEGRMTTYWQACAPFSSGVVGLDYSFKPPEDVKPILTRMASAFDVAFQRFTDLQQAEKRTKEAELEAAVERVRAHAMGMQSSDDFPDVLLSINRELVKLQLEGLNSAYIWVHDSENSFKVWNLEHIEQGVSGKIHSTFVNSTDFKFFERQTGDWKKHPEYFITHASKNQLYEFMNDFRRQAGDEFVEFADHYERELNEGHINEIWATSAGFEGGFLGGDFLHEPDSWVEQVMRKLADAFGMAYQRFEDLEKAEAQARESQIEAALERVRSRSMGMQSSDELKDVGHALFQQLDNIGLSPESSWISLVNSRDGYLDTWITQGNKLLDPKRVTAADHPNVEKEISAWEADEPFILDTIPKNIFMPAAKEIWNMDVEDRSDSSSIHILNVRHKYGFLGIGSWDEFTHDIITVYQRFAKVFEQTYTRFLDLKMAEQQAYESRVEASLERVRGMAAAMNHSDDLMQIAEAMFREMEILQINPLRYGLGMIDEEKKEAELWASTVDYGKYLDILGTLSLTWHPMLIQAFDAWEAQHEELIYELKGKELSDYYQKIGQINSDIPDIEILQDPDSAVTQYVSFFPFKTGTLYAFTPDEPNEAGKTILKRFANAFEQAHIRYEDLQIAEKQARLISEERDRLEVALKELKATKDQLVQQEKLASLGQLTAGIAHEIKNPLNFVNNFSDVSIELVEEAKEEVLSEKAKVKSEKESGDDSSLSLILEILEDIEANLRKIYEHGTRADSIVKSMLQHSRGGSGSMEPTNLNALVKEYVNLAFHGMRAANDPINVNIDLQLDESIGDFPLIAEDFSRVILNVSNNAFDAMKEKVTGNGEQEAGYEPKLIVRTQKTDTGISIDFEDNGTGIPEEMMGKVLQPFFTTKKGTSGTGLGLSITNDIIKAHGGDIKIESVYGSGTHFKIFMRQN